MATRKVKKLIYNTIVICLLAGALIYVCSRFLHLGNNIPIMRRCVSTSHL